MKIHWLVKLSAFVASVICLSWFFAGFRQVLQTGALWDWCLLSSGAAGTIFLVLLQGYWIYFEEKARGRLCRRIELFEQICRVASNMGSGTKGKGAEKCENREC